MGGTAGTAATAASAPRTLRTVFTAGLGWGLPEIPDLTLPPSSGRCLRFVAISDTHGKHDDLVVPDGDVLLVAGDITYGGTLEELRSFDEWVGKLPHQHKIVIAGNHDFVLDEKVCSNDNWKGFAGYQRGLDKTCPAVNGQAAAQMVFKNCQYLCGESATVEGINIYGTPEQLTIPILRHRMAFNCDTEEEMATVFDKMPKTTDVLLTHGPPHGIGLDRIMTGAAVGSTSLRAAIEHAQEDGRLRWCVFGHIHEGYGVAQLQKVTCINAASVSLRYQVAHPPIVFDVPVPALESCPCGSA